MHIPAELPVTHIPGRVSLGGKLCDVQAHGLLASHREHGGGGVLARHEHAAAYICVVLAGGYAQVANGEIDCRRGSLVTHPAGHVHANQFGQSATRCVNMYLDAGWLDDRGLAEFVGDYRQVQLDPSDAALNRLEQEISFRDAGSALGVASAVLDLLGRAVRARNGDVAPAWLGRVRDAIAADPARVPELMTLAADAGVHPAHLCRAFRAATGESVGTYSRRLRLEAADAMLMSDIPIAEIALATGFCDQAHLARCFRRQFGMTPRMRRMQRAS